MINQGRTFQIGQTVFLRLEDSHLLRVGTLEDVENGIPLISFPPSNRAERRAPPVRIAASELIDAEQLPDPQPHNDLIYVPGRNVFHPMASDVVELLRLESAIPYSAEDVEAKAFAVAADGTIVETNERKQVRRNECYPLDFFAKAMATRWFAPVDPLYDILRQSVGENGVLTANDVSIVFPKAVLKGNFSMRLHGHLFEQADIELEQSDLFKNFFNDRYRLFRNGKVKILRPDGAEALISGIAIGNIGTAFRIGDKAPRSAPAKGAVLCVNVVYRRSKPQFSRETFIGVQFQGFTSPILHRFAPLHPSFVGLAAECLRTEVFGRPAIFYEPPAINDEDKYFAVLYCGSPLKDIERNALTALVGYICGGRGELVATETFSVDQRLSLRLEKRAPATRQKLRPIPLDPINSAAQIFSPQIPKLLEKLVALLKSDGSALNAALHHYAEGVDSNYAITRILRLSIALESLISLVTGDSQSNAPIIDPKLYKRLVRPKLLRAFDEAMSQSELVEITEGKRNKVCERLLNLNNAGNPDRHIAFWTSLGIRLGRSDIAFLKRIRNLIVH